MGEQDVRAWVVQALAERATDPLYAAWSMRDIMVDVATEALTFFGDDALAWAWAETGAA